MTEFIERETDEAYLDCLIEGQLDEAPYSVRIRSNFPTACWAFRDGRHHIFVGDGILDKAELTPEKNAAHYIASYFVHENAHARWTERDIKAIKRALEAEGIAFGLHNIFEDARIEHRFRSTYGRHFRWSVFENIEYKDEPLAIFFALIQQDGESEGLEVLSHYARVREYYDRACEAEDAWALIPILKEWNEEFSACEDSPDDEDEDNESSDETEGELEPSQGNEPETDSESSGQYGLEDLLQSLQMLEDDEAFEEAMEESEEIESLQDLLGPGEKHTAEDGVESGSVSIEEYTTDMVRSANKSGEWDCDEAKRLKAEFEKLFRDAKVLQNTRRPTRRLNLRDIARGDFDKPFREKKVTSKTLKKVVIIVDCSGSMSDVMPDMHVVLDVFSRLAETGHVEGHVVLSGVHAGKAMVETLTLPLDEATIGQIQGVYGSEGLSHAMSVAMPLMQDADWSIVLTDGWINDDPIDKGAFNDKGIRTYGIYIGDTEFADLSQWFDYQIVEPTPKAVVDKMIRLLK